MYHGGLDLTSNQKSSLTFALHPHAVVSEENIRKFGRLMDQDNYILIRKAEVLHMGKAKIIHSPPPIGSQMFSLLQERWVPASTMIIWENKHHNNQDNYEFLLSSSFPPAFTADLDIIWYGTFLWSAAVSWPSSVPSQPLAIPSLLAFAEVVWKDNLDPVIALLSSGQNNDALSALFLSQMQSTVSLIWAPAQCESNKRRSGLFVCPTHTNTHTPPCCLWWAVWFILRTSGGSCRRNCLEVA